MDWGIKDPIAANRNGDDLEETMKILVLIPSLHRGGAERVVSLLTPEWARSHSVVVAVFDTSRRAYGHGGILADLRLPTRPGLHHKIWNAVRRVGRVASLIRKENPDRIICFMESANFPAILASALSCRLGRLIVSVHNDPLRFHWAYRALMPLLYRLPDRIVAVSSGVSAGLASIGVPRRKLEFIPNPAPPVSNQVGKDDADAAVIPPRYILGVGRLHRQKGFDRLIRAFSSLPDPDLRLVILGEGRERASLQRLAEELRVADRVELRGVVENPEPWYRSALCFVLSSRHEGWPNVLMEAMRNGCPAISYDCRYGPSEILEHGKSGLLVADGDERMLAESIIRLLSTPDLRESLAEVGRRRVDQFSAERLAPLWLRRDGDALGKAVVDR
jgi:GalNAc-alpha-(1->4)-GalNAc-alpha-(1->3)-diNAcBac-PP-undecaprenol alpha-1,4-N-acetyl-D-galactosaminyltransferase